MSSEIEFKVRELERLLSEGKITLEQYLDARTKIENQAASQNSHQHLPTKQTVLKDSQLPNVKEPKKSYAKVILGLVLCAVILVGGFFAWGYLNPVYAENLTIESYSIKLFTKGAILFKLENTGNTDIRISKVMMNGYLNQSIENWNEGWNGTTFLQPNQKGVIYVYIFCYFYVLNASMPQWSSPPSQTEIENLYSWMESYNCTFTFVTDTQRQYNCTVPGLALMTIPAWMGALTFTFMGTEQLTISTLTWTGPNTGFTIKIANTGTKDVTISQIQVNYGTTGVTQPGGLPLSLKAGDTTTLTVTFAYVNGTSYDISVVTSSGYKFTNHFVGGQNNTTTQAGVMLKKDTFCLWKTGNVTIYIRNIGTSDAEIDKVYINSAPQTSVSYSPSKIVDKDGGTITIVVNYDWQTDTLYHFQISPKLGEPLSFDETSP